MCASNLKLINDISNLSYVLVEFCKKTNQTEDIQGILSLADCLNDKIGELYIKSLEKNI